jgi:protein O-mannosyl-transferase
VTVDAEAGHGPRDAVSAPRRDFPRDPVRVGPRGLALVLLLVAATYVDCLGYQLVWDDLKFLTNQTFRDIHNLPLLLLEDFTTLTAGEITGHYYRPVLALSLALDAWLWGVNPGPLHLTNLLLHLLATGLAARLALALGAGYPTAVLAALLFGVHPVHVEAVAFVSARDNLWLTVGVLTCVLAHRRAGMSDSRWSPWILLALGGQLGALLSKEVAVVLPALLVATDGLVPPRPGDGPGGQVWRRAVIRSLPFWGISVAFTLFRLSALLQILGGSASGTDLWGRLPGALETLARYLRLCLIPTAMQPYYFLERPTSVLAPWPALGVLAVGLMIGLMVWWWRRAPLAALALAWVAITVLPVVDLVPISFRKMGLADRYLYLPSVGICLLLALGMTALLRPERGAIRPFRMGVGCGAVLVVLVAYPALVLGYAPHWRNNIALFTRMAEAAPQSSMPHFGLGLAYQAAGDHPRAIAAMERSVRLDPARVRARTALGLLYVLQGRTSEGFRLLNSVGVEPNPDITYYLDRTKAHLFVGEWREALAVAEAGDARYPDRPDLCEWLGRSLERAGRVEEAIDRYRRALRLAPDRFLVDEALGTALIRAGRPGEAVAHLRRAAENLPDRVQPRRTLALLLEMEGRAEESAGIWREVLELAPNGRTIREAVAHLRRLEETTVRPVPPVRGPSPPGVPKS